MWFLIKGTFWFSMVLVLLSYFGTPDDAELAEAPGIEIGGAIAAATGAYSYISSICVEKPDVCIQGAETLAALGQRAKAGALVAYQILDEKLAEPGTPAMGGASQTAAIDGSDLSDTVVTGTVVTGTVVTGTVGQHADAGEAQSGEGAPLVLTVTVPVPRPRPEG